MWIKDQADTTAQVTETGQVEEVGWEPEEAGGGFHRFSTGKSNRGGGRRRRTKQTEDTW